jgi:hypothetical protein
MSEHKLLYICNRNLLCDEECHCKKNHEKGKSCKVRCGVYPTAKCERVMVVKGNPLGRAVLVFISKSIQKYKHKKRKIKDKYLP